jgi:ADP-heptose:LPS heptosyltransferase
MKSISSIIQNTYLLRLCSNIARLAVDTIAGFVISLRSSHISGKKKLLIIKTGAIGDFVIFSGILSYIRGLYSKDEWEITLLSANASHLLADFLKKNTLGLDGAFDIFMPIDEKCFSWNLVYRYKMQIDIAASKYDLVISPTFPRRRDESQILFISKSEKKIGFGLDDNSLDLEINRNNSQPNTKLFEAIPGWLTETDRNAHFIKMLGFEGEIDAVPRWKISEDDTNKARSILENLGVKTQIAVVCPGAAIDYRVWPSVKMADVIDRLWEKYGILSLIVGSSSEHAISEEIQSHLKSNIAICLCGKTSLVELSALMSISRLCVSMDSSPAHIAVAVNAPLVCVVGGGHYKRFFPYGELERFRPATEELDCFYCNWACKFDRPICVENISVETVMSEIDLLINST